MVERCQHPKSANKDTARNSPLHGGQPRLLLALVEHIGERLANRANLEGGIGVVDDVEQQVVGVESDLDSLEQLRRGPNRSTPQ
jgi:hypothetical protein